MTDATPDRGLPRVDASAPDSAQPSAPLVAASEAQSGSLDAYGWYRVFYAVCIAAMSALSTRDATGLRDHHLWLAALEIAGAALLVPRRTQRVGLVLLLGVFACAALLTAHGGRPPIALLLFAGTAVLVAQLGSGPRLRRRR